MPAFLSAIPRLIAAAADQHPGCGFRALFCVLLFCFVLSLSGGPSPAAAAILPGISKQTAETAKNGGQENDTGAAATPAPGDGQQDSSAGLLDLYNFSVALPRDRLELQNSIERLTGVEELREQLPVVAKEIEDITWKATTVKANPNLTFSELKLFEDELARVAYRLNGIDRPVRQNIERLEGWYATWSAKQDTLDELLARTEARQRFEDVLPAPGTLQQDVSAGMALIEEHLRANLLLGREITTLLRTISELEDATDDLFTELNEAGIEQTAPSMFTAQFYDQISLLQLTAAWQKIRLFWLYQQGYFKENLRPLLAGLALVLITAYLIHRSLALVQPSSNWRPLARRPLIGSLFLLGTVFTIVTAFEVEVDLPPNWDTLLHLPLIASIAVFAGEVVPSGWRLSLLRRLLALLAVFLIVQAFNLPQILTYLFVFLTAATVFAYYLYRYIRYRVRSGTNPVGWPGVVWGIFPLVIIGAGLAGYDQLAVILFGRILSFIAVTLLLRLLYHFSTGLFELLLAQVPWQLVKDNAEVIVSQIKPLIILAFFLLWVATSLVIFWIFPTLGEPLAAITGLEFKLFELSITPVAVLIFIFIAYATLLFSRGVRAFLLQDLLPRYGVEMGVQISITRLVHYAVLVVGFFILLNLLGFELNQITILGGALGVGIGFGLQAIVNNFVSGLILLFERPVKVGDVLEVGSQQLLGEVKELGLRATIVRTYDNAEIVIPNSELVTGSVTNWTLAEKKVRVRVPVGVAYGSDVTRVLEILLNCANEHPLVLSTPKPLALFLAFGASSLDFELRVWIPDFDYKLTVLSELNEQIEMEFDLAGIVIPFPQTDLHIKSVTDDAAAQLAK